MQNRPVIVTDADLDRLTRLVQAFKHSLFRDQQQLEMLDQKLAAAEVRPRAPRDAIRMNSCVHVFDFDTREKEVYTLTFPDEANIWRGMISVLAPLGIALLGRRKGDLIEVAPGGSRKLRVDGVRQQSKASQTTASEDRRSSRSHIPRGQETSLSA